MSCRLFVPNLNAVHDFGLQKNIVSKINLYVNQDDDNNASNPWLFPKLGDKTKTFVVHVPMILLAQHVSKKGHLYQEIKLSVKNVEFSFCPSHLTYVCVKHISWDFIYAFLCGNTFLVILLIWYLWYLYFTYAFGKHTSILYTNIFVGVLHLVLMLKLNLFYLPPPSPPPPPPPFMLLIRKWHIGLPTPPPCLCTK